MIRLADFRTPLLWKMDWEVGRNRSKKTSWEALAIVQAKDNDSLKLTSGSRDGEKEMNSRDI